MGPLCHSDWRRGDISCQLQYMPPIHAVFEEAFSMTALGFRFFIFLPITRYKPDAHPRVCRLMHAGGDVSCVTPSAE